MAIVPAATFTNLSWVAFITTALDGIGVLAVALSANTLKLQPTGYG